MSIRLIMAIVIFYLLIYSLTFGLRLRVVYDDWSFVANLDRKSCLGLAGYGFWS